MNGFDNDRRGKNWIKVPVIALVLIIIAYGVYKLFFIAAPVVEGIDDFSSLPIDKTIILKTKNLKSFDIFIAQGEKNIEILRDIYGAEEKTYTLRIKPKALGLSDGPATVNIKARAGILKEVKYRVDSIIDTIPPRIEVLKSPASIYQGTSGFAILGAEDADSVFIRLNENTFRAFKTPSGISPKLRRTPRKGVLTYLAFFPAPITAEDTGIFYAVAQDTAGNQAKAALSTKLNTRQYSTSSINIDDSFIKKVIVPLLNEDDTVDPEYAFKKANEDWREDSVNRLLEFTRQSESKILWEGRFLQLRNSKVMATYGDQRTYLYNGDPISKSLHLGYDLASIANAPVEAANSGIIRYAGDLGIYGNTVIIDHGLGVMSLYGHLSSILVNDGQSVEKGEAIALTGATGLAGGDHLHFGMLIQGYEVSPLHWWDSHWLKVNILDYLEPSTGL